MKKFLILTILSCLALTSARADEGYFRKKIQTLSYSSMEMNFIGFPLKSDYGASFSTIRTYFLHRKPIGGFIKVGIDACWTDLNYNKYTNTVIDSDGRRDVDVQQMEIGVQAGLSLTFNPVDKLNIALYGRYAPSYSFMAAESMGGGYVGYIVTGGRISYRFIGIGAEYRTGQGSYTEYFSEDGGGSTPLTMNGFRAYIAFCF